MTDSIQQQAQTVIDKNATVDQFGVSQTPFHTHNGSDSPPISKKNIKGLISGVVPLEPVVLPIINCALGNIFTITLVGNTTFSMTSVSAPNIFMVEVKQGSGTSYTASWPSGITWVTATGTAPVQTTASNGYTVYGFRTLSETTFLGYLIGSN